MINVYAFAVGFIVYIFFNIITFNVYSKKREVTNKHILFFIYVYYTLLAAYMIQLVDYSVVRENVLEVGVQILIFALAGGFYLTYYYNSNIAPQDEKYDSRFKRL